MNRVRRAFLLMLAFTAVCSESFAQPAGNAREAEAVQFASEWRDLVESGDAEGSYALLSPTFQKNLPPAQWRMVVSEAMEKMGKKLERKLRRIVWYDNPPNAPLPGLYAAVEFDSEFANTQHHFQYVMLHSLNGAPFRVMRNESTIALKRRSP
jgi:hypothetical protein